MAEQEVKLMKPRIPLKSIFRTTPESRKEYIKNINKYNLELVEQAKQKKLAAQEQQRLLDKYNKDMDKYLKAMKSVPYTYTAKVEYQEPEPVNKSSSSSKSRGSSVDYSRTTSSVFKNLSSSKPTTSLFKSGNSPTPSKGTKINYSKVNKNLSSFFK
jgi:hypothetical protein